MYHVMWRAAAREEFELIGLDYPQAESQIAAALDFIMFDLEFWPLRAGFPRSSSVHRMTYVEPLHIEYEVEDDKRVYIVA